MKALKLNIDNYRVSVRKGAINGELKLTLVEGRNYRWKHSLAFLMDDGRWIFSECWNLNKIHCAIALALKCGYEITITPK